ncbi:puromycin-sensitive aminopeptidase-like protein [Nannochloropsis oceanica]
MDHKEALRHRPPNLPTPAFDPRAHTAEADTGHQDDLDILLSAEIVRPLAYDVHLALAGPPYLATEGVVDITLAIGKPTSSIRLHAAGLCLLSVFIERDHGIFEPAKVFFISPQVIEVNVTSPLPVGLHVVRLSFAARVGTRSQGIYACSWGLSGNYYSGDDAQEEYGADDTNSSGEMASSRQGWILATHFEPTHCRRAFPCFDLAHFKAHVRLTLLVAGQDPMRDVLSNTEVELTGEISEFPPDQLGESGAAFVRQLLRMATDQQQELPQQQQEQHNKRERHRHHHFKRYHHHHKHSPCECSSSWSSSAAIGTDGSPPFPSSWHLTRFHQTPLMPLYVLGFWISRFEALEYCNDDAGKGNAAARAAAAAAAGEGVGAATAAEPVRVTVYLPPHRPLEEGHFALECARRSFEFFSALYQPVDCGQEAGERVGGRNGNNFYPLPKLDIICLPQMHGIGMEGWGSISILEEYLLVTPTTDFVRRRRIARLLAHETAHQWFGNLVTPFSFDELWLKESTARFFEYVALAALQPSGWHVWSNFVSEIMLSAMLADANPFISHPVLQHHHGDARAIMGSFDVLVYGKGAALLRMLSGWVGMRVFVKGIRRFMARFMYANVTEGEFWAVLEEVVEEEREEEQKRQAAEDDERSRVAGMTTNRLNKLSGACPRVSEMMSPWLARVAYPALHVGVEHSPGHTLCLRFSQRPFSLLPEDVVTETSNDNGQRSYLPRLIPLRVRVGVGEGKDDMMVGEGMLYTLFVGEGSDGEVLLEIPCEEKRQMTTTTMAGTSSCSTSSKSMWWAVINDQHTGYFTTVYDGPEAWQLVLHALEGGQMHEVERTGLVCDLMLGVEAALRAGGGGGGGRVGKEVGMLMERLAEVVCVLEGQRGESPTYWTGRLFMYDIELLRLLRVVEEVEREVRVYRSGSGRWRTGSVGEGQVVQDVEIYGTRRMQDGQRRVFLGEKVEAVTPTATASVPAFARLHTEKLAVEELLERIDVHFEWVQAEAQKEGKEPLMEYVNKLHNLRWKVWRLKARLVMAMTHIPLSLTQHQQQR